MSQYDDIPYIPTAEKLSDMIFSKLKSIRVESPKGAKYRRSDQSFYKTLYFRQIRYIFPTLDEKLQSIVTGFPIIEDLHPFHKELIDALFGIEKLQRSLSRITNTRKSLASIKQDISIKLGKCETPEEAKKIRGQLIGRVGSTITNLENDLNDLIEAKIQLSKVPYFNIHQKTIAFAGSPNAGKSSFVKIVSSGKPEIASYPFTTKELICGHFKIGFETIQLIDTPGLLDRPLAERNRIEIKSILALKHLAEYIIYLFDPSIEAVLPIEKQLHLFQEIKESFSETPILPLLNKNDISQPDRIQAIESTVGKLERIATIDTNREQLIKIVKAAVKEIPDRRFKDNLIIKKTKKKEDSQGSKGKIEWIFFDENDTN